MTDQPYTPTPDDLELFKKIAQLRYSNEQLRPEERQRAFDHFEHMLNAIESAAEQRGEIKALRDVEASLIDWDVLYGHEQGTAEDHESIRIAAWIGRRADQIANKEGDDE